MINTDIRRKRSSCLTQILAIEEDYMLVFLEQVRVCILTCHGHLQHMRQHVVVISNIIM
ncbi:hypothetical protein HanXRQr2_Chr03g0106721 [Helianthus annuus]|uniref:Uncharacterized protein n=1 Tax=Helianthus annuus TaxID=4232 RepID=A0A9K3NVF4_HELAN|nr:hypothetical protein HanXRQr2_Chr03g0106721 [Helianthus annuus]KAJ0943357.1 hypothetical protein HanPSC8_Chr03g0103271 [Helianthus annuus]